MCKRIITLTEEEYQQLISELCSLYNYHWNDDSIHANDCGSKVLGTIRTNNVESQSEAS